jgi:hypothetical protein
MTYYYLIICKLSLASYTFPYYAFLFYRGIRFTSTCIIISFAPCLCLSCLSYLYLCMNWFAMHVGLFQMRMRPPMTVTVKSAISHEAAIDRSFQSNSRLARSACPRTSAVLCVRFSCRPHTNIHHHQSQPLQLN